MGRVVLVTGVSRYLGSRLAAQLSADPSVERIVGVDLTAPKPAALARLGRTEFVRADIRNPLIGRVLVQAGVDTVVHASVTATPGGAGGRTTMKELNVIGTMQLLAACQKTETVRRFVLKSTTTVYGASPRDPAVFTEDSTPKTLPRSGYAKDAVEIEGYVRGFARRRPDIDTLVLRFANFMGPGIDSPLTRYLSMPAAPTALGFDPRIQFVHEDDAIAVLRQATLSGTPGTYNVAGSGAVLLSQAIRRAGHVPVQIPKPAVTLITGLVRRSGLVDFSPEQVQFLSFGRVVDTTRLREEFPFTPAYSTPEALQAFIDARIQPTLPEIDRVGRVAGSIAGRVLHAVH